MNRLRVALLERAFELLYGPLVLLHEPLGRLMFGPAWSGRRLALLDCLRDGELAVDVGAGSGAFVAQGRRRILPVVGFDPSMAMRAEAAASGIQIMSGWAWDLPLPDRSVKLIVSTYPGPWIFEDQTLAEFERVLAAGGRMVVLLGGTVECGPGSRFRSAILSLAYGRSNGEDYAPRPPETSDMEIEVIPREDQWGTAFLWSGRLRREMTRRD